MKTKSDEPAYPVHGGLGDDARNMIIGGGLTKRELFAMAAMQGILSNGKVLHHQAIADYAIECADTLIKQLNKIMSLTPEINKAISTAEDTNSMLTSLLKYSISKEDNGRSILQQVGKKIMQYEATIKKLTDSQRVWLDEFEARFDNDECPSHEIAKQYIDDATYMRDAFKRNDAGFINRVQDWYDNQPLPFGPK